MSADNTPGSENAPNEDKRENTCNYPTSSGGGCLNKAQADGTCWIDSHDRDVDKLDDDTDDATAEPDESDSPITITELRAMDEQTARQSLTVDEFERWESVNEHLDQHEQRKQEWAENDQAVTDMLTNDASAIASEVELFGDVAAVYYDPEDSRVRNVADRLGEAAGVDIESVDEADLSAEDIDESQIEAVKEVLADFVGLTLVEWNNNTWGDIPVSKREQIKAQMQQSRPNGWGLLGLMDALNQIIVAVEADRDERLGMVEKFRNPERRGDRRSPPTDGL